MEGSEIEVSVVVPFKNECECLPLLIKRLQEVLTPLSVPYEIILVDDGSTDDSWNVLSGPAFRDVPLRALSFSRNFGKESAIRAGLEESRGNATIVMDADLQHPPDLIPEMYAVWKNERVMVVEAVRKQGHRRGLLNAFGSMVFYKCLSFLAGIPLADATDFKLLDREVVSQVCDLRERITFFRGIVTWLGLPSRQIEFEVPQRAGGSTRWSLGRLISLAIDGITGFTTIPLRLVTFFSVFFILVSILLILQTFYNFALGYAVEGFTTVIICILLVGGVITGSLGIIGEYLARVYEEVKSRPSYVVRRRYGNTER
jgi:glycosyltransferase involved in cell wall biosynthesis